MKKLPALVRPEFIPLVAVCLLATALGLRPLPAIAMDTQLVLATEEIVKEMRENGELPPPGREPETVPAEAPPPEAIISPAEPGPAPAGSEPADLIVEASVVSAGEPAEPEAETPTLPMDEILNRRVSLKYVDADIRVVLRSLARAYGFNVTLAPEVQGKVTLDFNNVRIIDALETILVDQGLGYRVTGDIIRVTTQEKIQQETAAAAAQEAVAAQKATAEAEKRAAEEIVEPLVVEIFKLKFIDGNDAREAIVPMLTVGRGVATVMQTKQFRGFQFEAVETFSTAEDSGSIEFVRSRTLIVQDTQGVLDRIASVIAEIDRKPPQILIDAKILEVPIDQESRLGINWTEALDGWQVGASDLEAIFSKVYTSARERVNVTEQQQGWENRRETSRDFMQRSSVQSALQSRGYSQEQSQVIFDNYLNNVESNLTSLATAGQAYTAVLKATDFSLMLSAMRTDSNIVILSNPRVIVHENYAAQIFVGQRYPILKTEFSGEGLVPTGGTEVDEWREIGITLKVIPQIRSLASGDDSINMIIHPAVSDVDGYAFALSPTGETYSSTYPIISIREADTNVTISDGETIVIGGLISSRTMDKVSKIPLLGDIPILGYLFKEEHTQVEKINLLIFITARIVTEETEFSAYEKLMLEKMPPEALGDVRYFDDTRVRPYLYRAPGEPAAPAAEELTRSEEVVEETAGEEEAGNQGNFSGRITTRAMERRRR